MLQSARRTGAATMRAVGASTAFASAAAAALASAAAAAVAAAAAAAITSHRLLCVLLGTPIHCMQHCVLFVACACSRSMDRAFGPCRAVGFFLDIAVRC